MAFADRMFALEARSLALFGAIGTLSSSGTVYDAEQDRMVEVDPSPRMALMEPGKLEVRDDQGRVVLANVFNLQVEPKRGDTIAFAGETYTVGTVHRRYAGDVVTSYVAEVS